MRGFTAVLFRDGEITAAERKVDDRIRYGGPWMSAASALPLKADAIRPRPVARVVAASVRRPVRFAALIALLIRIPTEHVVLSETMSGQALAEYFRQRAMGIVPRKRFFRGVLLLPPEHATYLRGPRRQAVRRNLRRAAAAGIQCELVPDRARALDDISQVLGHHPGSTTDPGFHLVVERVRATAQRPESTVTVARDGDGRPVAVAAAIIDDSVCVINAAVATSLEARWALHDHLVGILIARRVKYLLADGEGPFGALAFTRNVQHFQHLLGYELRHVVPACTRRMTFRRCVLVSLVLVGATVAIAVPSAAATLVHRTAPQQALRAADRSAELR